MIISALILSWNEFPMVKESVLRMSKDNIEIWVVDNGSTDGTQEWLNSNKHLTNSILFKTNMGISVARNAAIKEFTGDYLLMLDGDIEYIPGSAEGLRETLTDLPKDTYCLGICCLNGVENRTLVTDKWIGAGEIRDDIAIAWTQYGLFKGDMIRKHHFPEQGAFTGPGWGYEDDYLNAEMEALGYKTYYCTRPLYYHEKHTGQKNLKAEGVNPRFAERMRILTSAFPDYIKWEDRLRKKFGLNFMRALRDDIFERRVQNETAI